MRKTLAYFCAFVFLLTALPCLPSLAETLDFAGGSGIRTDPYLITTKQHLNNVRNDLYAHYKLAADITFVAADFEEGGAFYNNGASWIAIGETTGQYTESFMGTFDGDGHSIQGLKVRYYADGTAQSYGLFGNVSGTIKNLNMVDIDISLANCTAASLNVGGIAGSTWESTITGCSVSGIIQISPGGNTSNAYVGGLVGYLQKSTLENCFSTTNILSKAYFDRVGGICGSNYDGFVRTVYNTGSVIGAYYCGGIAGEVSYASVTNAYNTGSIKSEQFEGFDENAYAYYNATGGIGGHLQSSEIARSYNIGLIESESAHGIASEMYSSTVSNCYYLDNTDYGSPWSGTTGKCSEGQMRLEETFANFDFDSVWLINSTAEYPYPQLMALCTEIMPPPPVADGNTTDFAGGTGTADDPYIIMTKTHLNNMRYYLDAYFVMMDDVEFTDEDYDENGIFYNAAQGWLPIGTDYNSPFTGWFNGNGHTISNLRISITKSDNEYGVFAGLFGYGENCVIENVTIDGEITVDVKDASVHVGSVIGYSGSTKCVTIRNCTNSSSIVVNTGELYEADIGGLAGGLEYGVIKDSINTGVITANYARIGGIIAYIANGNIEACSNSGKVNTHGSIGGIAASAWANITDSNNSGVLNGYMDVGGICAHFDGEMKRCSNTGDVIAEFCAGGLVGSALDGKIERSHNMGKVTTTLTADTYNGNAGGIAGSNQGATIQYCSNSATIIANTNEMLDVHSGGIVGYSSGGSIMCCQNSGDVYSYTERYARAGGIVGCTCGGSKVIIIDQCLNAGGIYALKGDNGICGGIAGDNYDATWITNCYNTGEIKSSNRPGGIIGLSYDSRITVKNCYNIGRIETTTPYSWIGGTDNPNVINCYYLDTSDYDDNKIVGFAAGKALTATEMAREDQFTSFDFTTIWMIVESSNYRYPVLRALYNYTAGDVNRDGVLDTADARYVLCHIVGTMGELSEQEFFLADVNEDQVINSSDVRRMLWTITNRI